MKQFDTLPAQYRHIEHLIEEVWCPKINYWQNDSFVNLAIFYLISSAYFFFHCILMVLPFFLKQDQFPLKTEIGNLFHYKENII